jgi:hypothetical protein
MQKFRSALHDIEKMIEGGDMTMVREMAMEFNRFTGEVNDKEWDMMVERVGEKRREWGREKERLENVRIGLFLEMVKVAADMIESYLEYEDEDGELEGDGESEDGRSGWVREVRGDEDPSHDYRMGRISSWVQTVTVAQG